jgi:hypothetical protein
LLKTNVNERFSRQELIIIIKLLLSIIFYGFPVLSFPVCIVQIFRSPEKRLIEVSLYLLTDTNISYFSGLDHYFVFDLHDDPISNSDCIVMNVYFNTLTVPK